MRFFNRRKTTAKSLQKRGEKWANWSMPAYGTMPAGDPEQLHSIREIDPENILWDFSQDHLLMGQMYMEGEGPDIGVFVISEPHINFDDEAEEAVEWDDAEAERMKREYGAEP